MPAPATTPEGLLATVLATHADAPLVTWYDETPGRQARVELSALSVANWAAKTAGLLGDELGLGPGDRVLVDLPAHWLTVGVLAGCWAAGVEVLTDAAAGPTADLAAAFVTSAAAAPDVEERFAIDPRSPLQLGSPDGAAGGARDLPTALRPHPDRLGPAVAGPDDLALDGRPGRELVAAAADRAVALGIVPGAGRMVWSGGLAGGLLVDAVLAPWSVGGSLVLVAGAASPDRLAAIAATEAAAVVRP